MDRKPPSRETVQHPLGTTKEWTLTVTIKEREDCEPLLGRDHVEALTRFLIQEGAYLEVIRIHAEENKAQG